MQINKIDYPACPIDNHASEPLSRICIDSKCEHRSVICCMCEYENHQSHKTVPIKQFLQELEQRGNFDHLFNPIEYQRQLNEIKKKYFNGLQRFRTEIIDQIQDLETKGMLYFNRCEQNLYNLSTINKEATFFTQNFALNQFKGYFSKVLALYSSDQQQTFFLKEKFDNFINGCKAKQTKLNQNLEETWNLVTKNAKKCQYILGEGIQLMSKLTGLTWSETLKGTKIKINGDILEQTGMESSGQRFGLIEESLPTTGKIRWGIRVKKFVGWVGLGICLKNIIKGANYHFNYTNIGHGSYLISTNGYSWSHSIKEFNSTLKTFQFTVNDVVYLEFDPKQNKLRFSKNTNGPEKFELDLIAPPLGDVYHPCVNLCSTGDAVEIIYPGLQLS